MSNRFVGRVMVLICVPSLAVSGVASAAPCRVLTSAPELLQPGVVIEGGEAVVVGSGSSDNGGASADPDASRQPSWTFVTAGGKAAKVATRMEPLAPGLARYIPARGSGILKVTTGERPTQVTLKPAAKGTIIAPLRAPAPTQFRFEAVPVPKGNMDTVTADFRDAIPTAVVAVIVYGVDDNGVATPRSYERVYNAKTELVIYRKNSRSCAPAVPGRVASKAGDTVAIAWVDKLGRVSPRSAALNVVQTPRKWPPAPVPQD